MLRCIRHEDESWSVTTVRVPSEFDGGGTVLSAEWFVFFTNEDGTRQRYTSMSTPPEDLPEEALALAFRFALPG